MSDDDKAADEAAPEPVPFPEQELYVHEEAACYAVLDEAGRVLWWGHAERLPVNVPGMPHHHPITPEQLSALHSNPAQHLVDGELVPIPPPPPPPVADQVRARRIQLLAGTDAAMALYALPDYPVAAGKRAALLAYRQALRDLPDQPGFPDQVEWPTTPS